MEPEFWKDCWREGRIGFHQPRVHRFLSRFFPELGLEPGAEVLVPLCGKSLDLLWLAEQGYAVTGVELEAAAVAAFFAEHRLAAEVSRHGPFELWQAGLIRILCGDLMQLTPKLAGPFRAVYDRAALIALPEPMRPRYAAKLAELLPTGGELLLISYAYRQAELAGPPFSVPRSELKRLFSGAFSCSLLHEEEALDQHPGLQAAGLSTLHEFCCRLRRL